MNTLTHTAKSGSHHRAIVYLSGILTGWNSVIEFTDSINFSRLRNLISKPTNVGSFPFGKLSSWIYK